MNETRCWTNLTLSGVPISFSHLYWNIGDIIDLFWSTVIAFKSRGKGFLSDVWMEIIIEESN